ncbi:zinc-binding dehydrogenase [Streptomyces sp. AC627_RSS907]|uniref:zinc-dependent alcohol dehydrogenase n=1 Tax=Streptomyces sp. AC627_RSS907 TaxID=2823684 RepID=UPI001C24BB5B|nr:alcohol dehydrogenase catalytic domain-containing protein [Streptomyces sp. AC627_RSS907]
MKALQFVRPGEVRWRDAPAPALERPDQALVAPVAATACDLDRAAVAGRTPFAGPYDLGHECVARIVEVGEDCAGLKIGDLVVVPWHIACGICEQCGAGRPTHCSSTPDFAMFGLPLGGRWGGMFSELLRVPWAAANLVPLPPGLEPAAAAAASDSLTDAYTAVAAGLTTRPGSPVLVTGGLTHALYACAFARALGAAEVVYLDTDARRQEIAAGYGARTVADAKDLGRERFPVTVDASASPEGLTAAVRATAPGGHCHSVGIYFDPVPLPLMTMYMTGITLSTSRPDIGPHLPAVLDLLSTGQVDPLPAYSVTVAFADLPQALTKLPAKPLVVFE